MLTSSNGNIFRVTGPLGGEFTSHRWIPLTEASDAEFDVFFDLRLNKPLSKQLWGWWFETPSRSLWRHCNGMWVNCLVTTANKSEHNKARNNMQQSAKSSDKLLPILLSFLIRCLFFSFPHKPIYFCSELYCYIYSITFVSSCKLYCHILQGCFNSRHIVHRVIIT